MLVRKSVRKAQLPHIGSQTQLKVGDSEHYPVKERLQVRFLFRRRQMLFWYRVCPSYEALLKQSWSITTRP